MIFVFFADMSAISDKAKLPLSKMSISIIIPSMVQRYEKRLFLCMLSFLLLSVSQKVFAQQFPVSLEQKLQIPVYDITNKAIATPWIGGLNNCQFGSIDLDMDGKKDLVIFDRHGYKILPFLNKGGVGEIKYEYAPQYASAFPKMEHWFQLVDYDGDGKEDIFTDRKSVV